MKKTVKILASLLAFMLLLTGCASNAAESDPKSQPSDSSDSSESTPIEVKKADRRNRAGAQAGIGGRIYRTL